MHNRASRASAIAGVVCLVLFALLAALLLTVDRAPIAGDGSLVGLASLNASAHSLLGESHLAETLSNVLLVVSLASMLALAVMGIRQIIVRRSLAGVSRDLWLLLGLYVVMLVLYVLFNHVSINNRPLLQDGVCEPSFPSSHTLLAVTTLGAAMVQAGQRMRQGGARTTVVAVCAVAMAALVIARALSGVHWATDILGGILLGAALVAFYRAIAFGADGDKAARGKHARR